MLADKSVQLKCNVEEEPPLDIWTVNYRLTQLLEQAGQDILDH